MSCWIVDLVTLASRTNSWNIKKSCATYKGWPIVNLICWGLLATSIDWEIAWCTDTVIGWITINFISSALLTNSSYFIKSRITSTLSSAWWDLTICAIRACSIAKILIWWTLWASSRNIKIPCRALTNVIYNNLILLTSDGYRTWPIW